MPLQHSISKERPVSPFSNGTESMIWEAHNCSVCKKAWFPKGGNWPSEKTLKQYVSAGKYCRLQYYLDLANIDGLIPADIAREIGVESLTYQDNCKAHGFCTLLPQCLKFSDDDNDRFHYPNRPRPDAPNQLTMPFIIDEIGFVETKKEQLESV